MKKIIGCLILCLTLGANFTGAAELKGRIVDSGGQPVEGVNVLTDISSLNTVTDRDGRFVLISGTPAPSYLTFSHISFQPVMVKVKAESAAPINVTLQSAVYPSQNIRVTAERAVAGLTPIAYSDFTNEDIKRDYTISEFPLLLESTPNLYAYADAGGGLGYSYLKIRGFDDKRISVYINGIPLNDPEDQATYFVDIPDFAADVTDIQVQRGIGNSLYGDASFGGSVNIASGGLERPRRVTVTSGWGGFYAGNDFISQMRKQSVEYASGLLDGRWNLTGRYSKQYSGGYRENSWYDGWAYYFSIDRLDPKMTTSVKIYGVPMKMHLAYYGIDRATEINNRRANWLTYPDETDNFNQPHYELHNVYRLNDRLTLRNTLYYITGRGYYEQYKADRDYYEYDIPPSATVDSAVSGDLIRQKWVSKSQYGWNPRLDWDHQKGSLSLGGSFYYFNSDHWGRVIWAEGLSNAVNPEHRYYQYFGKKYLASLYLHEYYYPAQKIRLMGDIQLKYLNYDFDQNRIGALHGYQYNLHWLFVSPRAGLTYLPSDKVDLFFSFAASSREPEDVTIYDAEDPWSQPALEIRRLEISPSHDTTFIFGDPTIKPERLYDFELGGNFRSEKLRAGLNLYWMEFRKEIIPEGGLNENGRPRLGNADRSVHSGVEFNGSYNLLKSLTVSGNASYSYNRLKKYLVYDTTDAGRVFSIDYSGNPTPGFPEYIANLLLDYKKSNWRVTYRQRAIGRQYVENGKLRDLSIAPYMVAGISATYSLGDIAGFGRFALSARVDNLFNEKYELSGYAYEDSGQWYGEYFPAAERNFFIQLKWELE
ncbi:MAG: TonB-dependent receptor [candidate division Zixibacteria bacterium]|nr:TonB-dependent receptor [candidate division Zixibacteria bacterium]